MNQDSSFLGLFRQSPAAREAAFGPGETIFAQGEPGDSVFVVKTGKAGIFRDKGSGREMIAMRGPGHLVGEMALFGQKRRTASLVAISACTLLHIENQQMLQLLEREPALGVAISRLLAVRLQELMDQNLEEKNRELETSALAIEADHREMESVLDFSVQGILCFGANGLLRWTNAKANELLSLGAQAKPEDELLPESLVRVLERGPRVGDRISVDGRALLVEAEPLSSGGQVVFLTAKEEIGRMAQALSELGANFTLEDLAGISPQMLAVRDFVQNAAQTTSNVLIQGEPGTGKALVAQAIHNASDRWHEPFVTLQCSTIPDDQLEAELFGSSPGESHVTGSGGPGKLEEADGGTLFLDEVGELPLALQANLFRILRDRKLKRERGRKPMPLDVRILATTSEDLDAAVTEGEFRKDLLNGLRTLQLTLPPLRQRPGDIPVLARTFLEQFSERQGKRLRQLSSKVLSTLSYHSWPGNVGELEDVLERAVRLAEPHEEVLRQIELPIRAIAEDRTPIVPLAQVEAQAIRAALRTTGGNVAQAAEGLGLPSATLFRKLKSYGIDRKNP